MPATYFGGQLHEAPVRIEKEAARTRGLDMDIEPEAAAGRCVVEVEAAIADAQRGPRF